MCGKPLKLNGQDLTNKVTRVHKLYVLPSFSQLLKHKDARCLHKCSSILGELLP